MRVRKQMFGHVTRWNCKAKKGWKWCAVRPAVDIGYRCCGVQIQHGLLHFMARYFELLKHSYWSRQTCLSVCLSVCLAAHCADRWRSTREWGNHAFWCYMVSLIVLSHLDHPRGCIKYVVSRVLKVCSPVQQNYLQLQNTRQTDRRTDGRTDGQIDRKK